eukprot:3925379-Amphidinium_carterae.1
MRKTRSNSNEFEAMPRKSTKTKEARMRACVRLFWHVRAHARVRSFVLASVSLCVCVRVCFSTSLMFSALGMGKDQNDANTQNVQIATQQN